MTSSDHDPTSRWGTAFIVWDSGPSEQLLARQPQMRDEWLPRYDCLLQPDDDDHERDEVAEGPSTASLDEALAWAYPRARKVLVRPPWDTGRHYLADGGPPDRWKPID